MDESKKAAKAFVDQYFPVKESRKSTDVWGELFQSSSKRDTFRKHGNYGSVHSLNSHSGIADGKLKGSMKKGQNIPQKGNVNSAEHCAVSEPCLMSSSVDYGCRDNYPYYSNHGDNHHYNPDSRYPCPSTYIDKKDKKEGSNYDNLETQGGAEWWQGSYYY